MEHPLNEDDLVFGHGLDLTDEDFQAIGTVVATWAHAEKYLTMTVNFIAMSIKSDPIAQRKKPPHGIREWLVWLEKLYPIAFAGRQMHLQICKLLIDQGVNLSKQRNRVSHWLISRKGSGMDAYNPDSSINNPEQKEISSAELQLLASDINRWRADVSRLLNNIYTDIYHVPYLTKVPPLYSRIPTP
jgi:hypothetical protein